MDTIKLEDYFQTIQEIDKIPDSLVIMYSDLHEYHGGVAYEVNANHMLIRTLMQRNNAPETRIIKIKDSHLHNILRLICELKLWEQKEIPRPAHPDESKAFFYIEANGKKLKTWEWYNDLSQNNCLIKLRNKFEEIFDLE